MEDAPGASAFTSIHSNSGLVAGVCAGCAAWGEKAQELENEWMQKYAELENQLYETTHKLKKMSEETMVSQLSDASHGTISTSRTLDRLSIHDDAQTLEPRQIEVLSVDDDPVNQMVVENLLEPLGYKIIACMVFDFAVGRACAMCGTETASGAVSDRDRGAGAHAHVHTDARSGPPGHDDAAHERDRVLPQAARDVQPDDPASDHGLGQDGGGKHRRGAGGGLQ